jgi:hypothetical protein
MGKDWVADSANAELLIIWSSTAERRVNSVTILVRAIGARRDCAESPHRENGAVPKAISKEVLA